MCDLHYENCTSEYYIPAEDKTWSNFPNVLSFNYNNTARWQLVYVYIYIYIYTQVCLLSTYIDIIGGIKLQLSTLLSIYIDIIRGIKLQVLTLDSESLRRIHTSQFSNPIKNFHFSIVQYSNCVIMPF